LLTLISTRDYSYRQGREVEPDTFVRENGYDSGILHHYFTEDGARRLLGVFEMLTLRLEESDMTDQEGSIRHRSHWRVQVRCP